MKDKLYLGQLIDIDKVDFGSNNLILSPVGSGKTHLIMDVLRNSYDGNKLMLVSTTSLKDSYESEENILKTSDLSNGSELTRDKIHVMTYAEFGSKVKWNNKFLEDYSVIFCDEIHSLFDYYFKFKVIEYAMAIRVLFERYKDKALYYFTATSEKIDKFVDIEKENIYEELNVIDYLKDPRIVSHLNRIELEFTTIEELEEGVLSISGLREMGEIGLIYNERIDSMKKTEDILISKGLRPISIWSVNNTKHKMSTEQLFVRHKLLTEGILAEGYDFLIINGSMQEGWNFTDDRLEFAALNTLDKTAQVQARGRIRKDISVLITRVEGESTPIDVKIMKKERALNIIDKYIGKYIDNNDKKIIANELNVINEITKKIVQWPTIKDTLKSNGYLVEDIRKTIDGERKVVSVITYKDGVKNSDEIKSNKFLSKLVKSKFAEVNQKFLDKYLGKGTAVGMKHIQDAYSRYIVRDLWTERKLLDVTYLLARDNKLFSDANYIEYGQKYKHTDELEILKERAKYEVSALMEFRKLESEKEKREKEIKEAEEKDLLAYIIENGG